MFTVSKKSCVPLKTGRANYMHALRRGLAGRRLVAGLRRGLLSKSSIVVCVAILGRCMSCRAYRSS